MIFTQYITTNMSLLRNWHARHHYITYCVHKEDCLGIQTPIVLLVTIVAYYVHEEDCSGTKITAGKQYA